MAKTEDTNNFTRLKRYTLTSNFTKLDETIGIIENISNSLVEISSQPERGTGIVLYPRQICKIRGTTYAAGEAKEHATAAIAVEGGVLTQESSSGSLASDTPDITPALNDINATLQLMNTSISNANFGSSCSCNFGGLASETTHERIAVALESLAGADFGGSNGNGLSAYEVALGNGFTGTVQEWLDSLKGDPYNLPTGTSVVLGGVKSSSLEGSVTINPDGTMQVNALGTWGLLKLDSIGYYVDWAEDEGQEEQEEETGNE